MRNEKGQFIKGHGKVGGESAAERFFKYSYLVEGGCWIWTSTKNNKGYGKLGVDGKEVLAHRWIYEQMVGSIPKGLDLDHLCKNPACVNFDHLEAVTHQENCKRGMAGKYASNVKTHCKRGHEFTKENTYIWKDGRTGRGCKICAKLIRKKKINGNKLSNTTEDPSSYNTY